MAPYRISLAAHRDEVARLNAWAVERGQALNMPRSQLDALRLCLHEAVTNIVSYGRANPGPLAIEVELTPVEGGVEAVVMDNSFAFNPLDQPEPLRIAGLNTAQIGGFGIGLIRSSAASVSYARQGNYNRLTLLCRPRP